MHCTLHTLCSTLNTPHSSLQVTSECEQRMVGDHLTYLHSECKPMVAGERRADLANLYRLLKPIAGAQAVSLDMHLC